MDVLSVFFGYTRLDRRRNDRLTGSSSRGIWIWISLNTDVWGGGNVTDHDSIVIYVLTSIRKLSGRFMTREFVEWSFFSRFFVELQLRANRGGRNFCNINLSWERRRE